MDKDFSQFEQACIDNTYQEELQDYLAGADVETLRNRSTLFWLKKYHEWVTSDPA